VPEKFGGKARIRDGVTVEVRRCRNRRAITTCNLKAAFVDGFFGEKRFTIPLPKLPERFVRYWKLRRIGSTPQFAQGRTQLAKIPTEHQSG
jgi:hypothetical protein